MARWARIDAASGKPLWRWSDAGRAVARSGTPSPTTRKSIACTWVPAMRAAPMPRRIAFACSRGRAERRYRRDGLALRLRARRSPAMRRSTDITLATINHRRASRATSSCMRRRTARFHVLDRATGKLISVEEARHRCAQPLRAIVQPEERARVPAHHRVAGIERPTATRRRMPARARCVAWDPVETARRCGQYRRRARSAAACSRRPATSCSRDRPTVIITAYSAAEGRRAWAFYSATAALGAPISFAIGKRQYISILNGPTQGAAGSLGAMSAQIRLGLARASAAPADLRARWHRFDCRPRRVRRSPHPSDGRRSRRG